MKAGILFPCLLWLVVADAFSPSSMLDVARRRSEKGAAASQDRRRRVGTSVYPEIVTYIDSVKQSGENRNRENELLTAENAIQVETHDEVRNQREDEITKVVNKLVGGDGRMGDFMKKVLYLGQLIGKVQKSTQALIGGQDNMKVAAEMQKAQLNRVVYDVHTLDKEEMGDLRSRMAMNFKSLFGEIATAEADMKAKRDPITDIFSRDTTDGVNKFDDTMRRIKMATRNVVTNVEHLTLNHNTNLEQMDTFMKQYQIKYDATFNVLERIPEMISDKEDELIEAIREEGTEQNQAFKDTNTLFNEKDKDLRVNLVKVTAKQAKNFDAMTLRSKEFSKENLALAHSDVADFETAAEISNVLLNKDMHESNEELIKEAKAMDTDIVLTNDALDQNANIQLAFPKAADQALDQVKLLSDQTLESLGGFRKDTTAQIAESFGSASRALSKRALASIKQKFRETSGTSELQIDQSADRAVDAILPSIDKLADEVKDGEVMGDDLGDYEQEVENYDAKLGKAKGKLKKETGVVKTIIHRKDKGFLVEATTMSKDQKRELRDAANGISKAKSKALLDMSEFVEKLETEFDDSAAIDANDVQKRLKSLDDEVLSVEGLGNKMKNMLGDKIAAIATDLDDVRKVDMPDLMKGGHDFMNHAAEQVDAIPAIVDSAIETASSLVNGHLEGLESVASMAVRNLKNAVTPLQKKTDKIMQDGKKDWSEKVFDMETEATDSITKTKNIVDKTGEQNRQNSDNMLRSNEDFETALSDAEDSLESNGNTLTNNLVAHRNQLSEIEDTLSSDIAKNVEITGERLDTQMGSADTAMKGSVHSADAAAGAAWQKLHATVDRVTKTIDEDGHKLGKGSGVLKQVLAQVRAELARIQASVSPAVERIGKDIAAEDEANAAGLESETASIAKQTRETEAAGAAAINSAEQKVEGGFAAAEKEVGESQKSANDAVAGEGEIMQGAIGDLEKKADSEVKELSDDVGSLEEKVAVEEKSAAEHDLILKNSFADIKSTMSEQHKEFAAQVSEAGEMLASLVGKENEKMQVVIGQLGSTTAETRKGTTKQHETDQLLLDRLIQAAKDEQMKVKGRTDDTNNRANQFAEKLDGSEEAARDAVDESMQLQEDFDASTGAKASLFANKIGQERMARENQTSVLSKLSNSTTNKIHGILHQVIQLEKKVNGQVKWHTGTLDLDDEKMEREISKGLKLGVYQEADALTKVKDKAFKAWDTYYELQDWKKKAQADTKDFRRTVDTELGKLGEELDLSELDLAKEKAAESYATKTAMEHIKNELGEEVDGMSRLGQDRLNELAAETGRRINDVMNDDSLSEEEKAEKIRQLNQQMKDKSKKLLDEDGRRALEQATAARNMEIATGNVNGEISRIADLTGSKQSTTSGLEHTINRIKELLTEAGSHLADGPTSLEQVGEMDPVIMLKAAKARTHNAVKEDKNTLETVSRFISMFA